MVNIQRYTECKSALQKRIDVNHEPSDELLMHLLDIQMIHIEDIKELKNENKILKVCLAIVGVGTMLLNFLT